MKILVTGAAGFIGMTTTLRLLERGDEVVGLDNMNDYYDVTLKERRLARLTPHPSFRFYKGDVADRPGMEQLFATEKFDRVIHLAAQAGVRYSLQNPQAYVDSNVVHEHPGRLPPQPGWASGLCIEFQRLWWQHPDAVLGA